MTGTSRINGSIFIFINCLFLYKYGSRVTEFAGIACLMYIAALCALLHFRHYLPTGKVVPVLSVIWIAGITLAVHYLVPLASLNVDRWSVISGFLDTLYSGEYPYAARSHMGNPPGPMPVYYLVAAPFYALDALEWLAATGYLLAIAWVWNRRHLSSLLALLVVTSPFMYWEIAARSNIFTFSIIALIGLQHFRKHVDYFSAAFVGAMLATRSVYVLAYIPYYLTIWRARGTVSFLGPATFSALVFLLIFLPFWIIWPEPFSRINPFIVQGSFLLPPQAIAIALVAAAGISFWRTEINLPLLSGLLLFGVILLYSVYHLYNLGWQNAYLDSKIDLSYFIFCVPFLGYAYIHSVTTKERTGRWTISGQ